MRVDIGGGQWAEIKPVEELTRADRRAVNGFVVYEINSESGRLVVDAGRDDDAAAACMACVITDWSFPLPPPSVDIKSLDKLTLAQDSALRKAIEPHLNAILGRTAPVEGNPVPTAGSAS